MKDNPQKFAPAQRDLVIEVWQRLRRPSIGGRELRVIQSALTKRFGAVAVPSPASIARLLADEGAELRHPEVIEFDARWRASQINAAAFPGENEIAGAQPLTLKQAENLIEKLERRRKKFEQAGDESRLQRLRYDAISARRISESFAKDLKLKQSQREEQNEIAEWLTVWLQTPKLFAEWLELRRRSADFRKRLITEKDR